MDMKDIAVGKHLQKPDLTPEEIADLPLSQPLPISRSDHTNDIIEKQQRLQQAWQINN